MYLHQKKLDLASKKRYLCSLQKSSYYIVYETAENYPVDH